MAHWLGPRDGRLHLDPAEVVTRLREEFAVVDEDPVAGAEHVASMARQLERMGLPDEHIVAQRQLQDRAIQVELADDPDSDVAYLRFVLLPGQPILIGYSSAQHERAARPLLTRCRRVLGYVSART